MYKRFRSVKLANLKYPLLICIALLACAAQAAPELSAVTLRAKYTSLQEQLKQNQFNRPLVLDSAETTDRSNGEIYAIVDYSFANVNTGLNDPDHWCDILLLHINTKYCHALVSPSGTVLRLNIGKKTPEDLAHVARFDFNYSVVATTPEYLEIVLSAKDGPLGTSDYRILLEAVALPGAKAFLHLTYSYTMNFSAHLAIQAYLGTIGSGKVGFTVIGKQADGQTEYIGGVRGLVERNTMRYYLAIDSFLGAASAPPEAQFEKRLKSWFMAVERYPRQLHEMDQREYIEMKHAENLRQQKVY